MRGDLCCAPAGGPLQQARGWPPNMDAATAEPATTVNDLSPACFVAVFSRLGADEAARAMCVHPLWALYLRDDILWRAHVAAAFARSDTALPGGGEAPSFRRARRSGGGHRAPGRGACKHGSAGAAAWPCAPCPDPPRRACRQGRVPGVDGPLCRPPARRDRARAAHVGGRAQLDGRARAVHR